MERRTAVTVANPPFSKFNAAMVPTPPLPKRRTLLRVSDMVGGRAADCVRSRGRRYFLASPNSRHSSEFSITQIHVMIYGFYVVVYTLPRIEVNVEAAR